MPDGGNPGERGVHGAGQRQGQHLRDAANEKRGAGDVEPYVIEREHAARLFAGKSKGLFQKQQK